ncbi:GMP synthase [Microbacterium oxydans]|jgi:GMP synthase (glutamine-hydrolysing)|uniref:Gamma-glutamyl-L-1-hydroxyisopropylamide hydrolase n=1 Tax=Microbacterium oxydans TaxID=82380 RepID=A0A3Q9J5H9_9MICO|nr:MULTISPECIES: GMP synthase [Microbacterium]AZS41747.1 Gamma-glutamyl-L-1-hydroxyisopropylamide hydrolase [Microbacterium oxydans]KAB1893362.1 GMP synthase [Microbacterium oxydans]MBE7953324.1 GMP synthase [Microbacterium sp. R1]MCB8045788.1 GMP synthase [Microbacterium oxydans]GED37842.1 glutamine amidotransferase [Microbacterium oxydans]
MASLLYVCVRPETGAADAEHASFRRALGVDVVDRLDLLHGALPMERLRGYRGIVVGGSPFNVSDAVKSAEQLRVEADLRTLADAAMAAEVAVFFTCFSIGVVTRMLGGEVVTDTPEPASATVIETTQAGAADPVFGPSGSALTVFTAHKESAAATPPGAVLLATNEACPVQAYRVGTHLYAAQFHPEPTPRDFADRMTFYRTTGYFDPDEFDAVQQQVLAASVTEGAALLRRFAETFA